MYAKTNVVDRYPTDRDTRCKAMAWHNGQLDEVLEKGPKARVGAIINWINKRNLIITS